MILRLTCSNCAYMSLEPGHEFTDICTHNRQPIADVEPDFCCPLFSRTFLVEESVFDQEDLDEYGYDGMPNARPPHEKGR